jgi:hypothetical protein
MSSRNGKDLIRLLGLAALFVSADAHAETDSHTKLRAWASCLESKAKELKPQPCAALKSMVDLVYQECSSEEAALREAMLPEYSGSQERVDLVIKMTSQAIGASMIPREPGNKCAN